MHATLVRTALAGRWVPGTCTVCASPVKVRRSGEPQYVRALQARGARATAAAAVREARAAADGAAVERAAAAVARAAAAAVAAGSRRLRLRQPPRRNEL